MRYLILIAMFLFAGSVSAERCTTLHNGKTLSKWASEGRLSPVKSLIRNHCDANSTSLLDPADDESQEDTALQAAIKSSNPGALKIIGWLANRDDVNIELLDSSNLTPLMLAARHDNVPAAGVLVAFEAAIDAKNDSGQTVLHYARTLEMFVALIDLGADVNATSTTGQTPLHVAAEHISEGYVVDLLIAKGAKTTINHFMSTEIEAHPYHFTPLMVAAMRNKPSAILGRLIALGAPVNASRFPNGTTAMHHAARFGHIANVRELIKAGADVNRGITQRGRVFPVLSAFVGAYNINRTEVIKELIAAGGRAIHNDGVLRPIISEHQIDKDTLRAILANPKPYWPIRAHAMGISFNSQPPASAWLEIGCNEGSGQCHVYLDCTDDDGAETGDITLSAGAMGSYSNLASGTDSIGAKLGLETDEKWTGRLDCDLRSQQRITAQVWSKTNTILANITDYTRSDENDRVILQRVMPGRTSQVSTVPKTAYRIRCIGEGECMNTALQCSKVWGGPEWSGGPRSTWSASTSIDIGKIDRLKTATLYNYARGDDGSDVPKDIFRCNIKSDDAFLVQILANDSGELMNYTAVSLE